MPRDAMGNVIPGSYGPQAMGIKPMNPSPRAAQMLQGTARALANPGAMQRNPMATAALQRANVGVAPPLAPAAAGAAVPTNQSDRAAQMLAMQRDQARMQAARAGAQPMDIAAQQQAQQAELMRQRQAALQRPMGLGRAMTA